MNEFFEDIKKLIMLDYETVIKALKFMLSWTIGMFLLSGLLYGIGIVSLIVYFVYTSF